MGTGNPALERKRADVDALARKALGARADAEHILSDVPKHRCHPKWIPEHTSAQCYITAKSALNLRSPAVGTSGDWHQSGWRFPLDNDNDDARTAFMSNGEIYAGACADTIEVFAQRELADAREALLKLRHPAGGRAKKVWSATHVRAIIEYAWEACLSLQRTGDWHRLLRMCDPTQVARWIATQEQWRELHAMAQALGSAKSRDNAMHQAWEEWRTRQCPGAHYDNPNARWTAI